MTGFEETLLRELATLPESRQADVLAFVRFLKMSIPGEEQIREEFKDALEDARATATQYNVTEEDIDAEIRAVRERK
jgi:hypothetical protein